MYVMKYAGYAALLLTGLAAVLAAVVKTAHAMGYEVPVLTKAADVAATLAGLIADRPMVAVRRARRA